MPHSSTVQFIIISRTIGVQVLHKMFRGSDFLIIIYISQCDKRG